MATCLCLADYFAPLTSGQMDVVAFQVVTVGQEATDRFDRLQAAGDYSEAYFTHGLAVQTAEAAAEYLHRHIRRELGLAEEQGKRYSWGYPAIPELATTPRSSNCCRPKALGMNLTPAYQLVPSNPPLPSSCTIRRPVLLNTGESRVEQLTR